MGARTAHRQGVPGRNAPGRTPKRRRPVRRDAGGPVRDHVHRGRVRRCLGLRTPSRPPHPAAHPRTPRPPRRPGLHPGRPHHRGLPHRPGRGQRRAFTANTIFRDNAWRKRDVQGTLRVSPHDAEQLGLSDGAPAQITTSRGTAQALVEIDDRLQPGHAALPNGFGLDLPTQDGGTERTGVALNTLTDLTWRDPIAGTPWHKHVPARIAPLPA
ncbi:molybdopterin dinucleotide binding domain-containing protein [Streptomyces sp. CA-251251]|uniref:molybdopterin dinucleotide binding domain-containing protein n=1 Tax=Streptomyces sp. CA-251251 TaxID=3240063 RepID=UPI003D944EA2